MKTQKRPNVMNIIKRALSGAVLIVLSGCASAPYTYNTLQGCGVTQWNEKWVEGNVESMSWTGACRDGVASGQGSHVIKLKNGKQVQYVGDMYNGRIYGSGTYVMSNGWKSEGNFQSAEFTEGKIFDETGKIMFEGKMVDGLEYQGKTITYADSRYGTGKVYVRDGSYYEGDFNGSIGMYVGGNAQQASVDTRHIKDGKAIAWVVSGKEYLNEATYNVAKAQYEARRKREIAANQAAEAAKQAASAKKQEQQDARRAAETSEALGQLFGTIGQVQQNKVDRKQARYGEQQRPQQVKGSSPSSSISEPGIAGQPDTFANYIPGPGNCERKGFKIITTYPNGQPTKTASWPVQNCWQAIPERTRNDVGVRFQNICDCKIVLYVHRKSNNHVYDHHLKAHTSTGFMSTNNNTLKALGACNRDGMSAIPGLNEETGTCRVRTCFLDGTCGGNSSTTK